MHLVTTEQRRRAVNGRIIGLFLMMIAIGGMARAADHYVRAGATGTGVDWGNASGQLPPTLTRGDTYWVAAGNYPGYSFTTPASGTTPITVKKATAQEHGAGAGWQASYGEGVAVWGPMSCSASYIVFDGVTGAGKSGHGFEIFDPAGTNTLFKFTDAPKFVTISHVNMHFKDRLSSSGDAVYGDTPCQNITVSHSYIHDIGRCPVLMRNWQNLLLEHCWIARNKSTAADHAEGISTHGGGGHIIRHNVWEDIEGTAVIVNLNAPTSNWEIYGNVFFQTPGSGCTGVGHGLVGDNFGTSAINGLKFYNNSAYGITGVSTGLRFWASGSTGIVAQNNLWAKCQAVGFNQVAHDYNAYYDCATTFEFASGAGAHEMAASGDPFVNSAAGDFRLKAPTAAGTTLAAPWNIDPENKPRGGDGNWDRGAFEFGGTPGAAPQAAASTMPTTTTSAAAGKTSETQTAQGGQAKKKSAAPDAVSGATQSRKAGGSASSPVVASASAPSSARSATPGRARASTPAQSAAPAARVNSAGQRAPDAVSGATQSAGAPAPANAPAPASAAPLGMMMPMSPAGPDAVSGATQAAGVGAAEPLNGAPGEAGYPANPAGPDAVSEATQPDAAQASGGGVPSARSSRRKKNARRGKGAAKAEARPSHQGSASSAEPAAASRQGFISIAVGGAANSATSGSEILLSAPVAQPRTSGGSEAVSGTADAVSGATQTAHGATAAPESSPAPAPVVAPEPIPAPVEPPAPIPAPPAPAPDVTEFVAPASTPAPEELVVPTPEPSALVAVAATPYEAPEESPAVNATSAALALAANDLAVTTGGLVAAYDFSAESDAMVKDLSGKGNNGLAVGAKWSPAGKFGGCMVFNGTSDRIMAPHSESLALSAGMTLEAWICPIDSLNGWRSVMMKEQTWGAVYYLYANTQYERPGASVFIGNEVLQVGGERPAMGVWTHLAATYDGAAQRLYVNGREVARRRQHGAIQPSKGALWIGGNTIWGEHFMGRIDEVRIYNRALSAEEIARDMDAPVK